MNENARNPDIDLSFKINVQIENNGVALCFGGGNILSSGPPAVSCAEPIKSTEYKSMIIPEFYLSKETKVTKSNIFL